MEEFDLTNGGDPFMTCFDGFDGCVGFFFGATCHVDGCVFGIEDFD